MQPQTFDLPCAKEPSGRRIWRLDARGLEWTPTDGAERWMPFACVRLASLGQTRGRGWLLRLSGPPGAVLIEAGSDNHPDDVSRFKTLASAMIEGAAKAGCGTRFRINHGTPRIEWLWARRDRRCTANDLMNALQELSNAA